MSPLGLAYAYTNFTEEGCPQTCHLGAGHDTGQMRRRHFSPYRQTNAAHDETVTTKEGTGSRARVPGYRSGGKTGTAHRVGRRGYEEDSYTSLYAGIAPISNPDLVLVVVIDDPKGKEYYGGEVAAPYFRASWNKLCACAKLHPMTAVFSPYRLQEACNET